MKYPEPTVSGGADGHRSIPNTDAHRVGEGMFITDNLCEPSFSAIQRDIEQRRERIARRLMP